MRQFAIGVVLLLLALDVSAGTSGMGHIYNFTDDVQIYRNHKAIELDHGVKVFKNDVIMIEKKSVLYIENCMGEFNELIILTGGEHGATVRISDALYNSSVREKTGSCLIQKQFIKASNEYLGINLRGGDLEEKFKIAEKEILDGIDEKSKEYPQRMLSLLTLYLKYNKISQVKQTNQVLKKMHPDSDYLKTIDAYLQRLENSPLN